MFVIVASSAKSDIESKECVCLSEITKIESCFDKIRVSFNSAKARNTIDIELVASAINFTSISSLTIEFEYKQVIAIIP